MGGGFCVYGAACVTPGSRGLLCRTIGVGGKRGWDLRLRMAEGPVSPGSGPAESDPVSAHHIEFGGGEQTFQPLVDAVVADDVIRFEGGQLG